VKKFLSLGLLVWSMLVGATALFEHEKIKIEKYMNDCKWSRAINQIKKTENNFKNSPRLYAKLQVLLSACQSNSGEYSSALKTLNSIKYHRPPNWRLEQSKAYYGLKNYKKALNATKYYSIANGVHLYLPSIWIRAQIQMKLEAYRPCMASCRKIFKTHIEKKPKGLADFKLSDFEYNRLKELQKESIKLYYESREAYDIKTYGMDFAIYRKAREAHFNSQYKKARKLYSKIKEGTLKEAAGCYTAECYIAENRINDAYKLYAKMFKEAPYGLYRGEILYSMVVSLYLNGRATNALKVAIRLRNWHKELESSKQTAHKKVSLENINDALKREIINTAPRTFLKNDDCGNLIATARYPGTINNRLTSPWYIPNLKIKGELLYGFLLGEKRQAKTAAQIYSKAKSLTQMQIISDRHAISNLIAGLIEGSYLIPKQVDRKLKGFREQVRMACFYYVCDEKDKAEKMFASIIKYANVKRYPYDAAAARLGLVICLIERHKASDAIKIVDRMEKVASFKKMEALMEARYLRACIYAKNKGTLSKAMTEFQSLSKKRRNAVGPKALLAMALAAANHGNKNLCINTCKRIRIKYRNHPLSRTAGTLLAAIKKNPRNSKSKHPIGIINTMSGRVVVHRRVVIIPNTTQWKRIRSRVTASDIVLYQIKFVPRSNCQIVRRVWMNLDPGEPSPPNAVGDEICFVRAPILFKKSLQYNMNSLLSK
jgi:hypothetical protein